jgi:hypothetical protein
MAVFERHDRLVAALTAFADELLDPARRPHRERNRSVVPRTREP